LADNRADEIVIRGGNVTKIAVIGCGRWGPNHVRCFASLPGCRVDVIVDLDPERLEAVRQLHPGVRCEQDHWAALDDPAIDAVVVATPLLTHYQLVRDALSAGKHVLCEKPLCETSKEGQELVELARAEDLRLMVGHVFLFNPGVERLRELVLGGDLGRVYYLAGFRTNLGPIRDDANAAYDLAAHDVAIFNWLLGAEPETVSATGAAFIQPEVEDVVCLSLRYPGGVLACVQASWLDPKKVRQITAVGSQRMATWDDLQLTAPLAIYDKGASAVQDDGDFGEFLRLSTWDGDIRLPKVRSEEPLKAQARHFLQAVAGGRVERSDGPFAVGVVRTLQAAAASIRVGGRSEEVVA
jgi:predicted dehydrogenase